MKPTFRIPARLAPLLGVDQSLISRWNNGKRRIPDEMATKIVDLLKLEGIEDIHILKVKPSLNQLLPYLCPLMHYVQRELRKKLPAEADRPAE